MNAEIFIIVPIFALSKEAKNTDAEGLRPKIKIDLRLKSRPTTAPGCQSL